MIRGTTPTIKFELEGIVDLTICSQIWITFESNNTELTFDLNRVKVVDAHSATVTLTQEETLRFTANYPCKVQMRYLYGDGRAYATPSSILSVNEVLNEEVINNG